MPATRFSVGQSTAYVRAAWSRPIDMGHLAKQALGDWGIELEVLRVYDDLLESYGPRVGTVDDAAETGRALYMIRGASSGVGAWGIRDFAAGAEAELAEVGILGMETVADLAMAIAEVRMFIAELVEASVDTSIGHA
ncbi:MAG: Hpt protein [Devosia sp.]|nr:Hpt protein [Devosia sp.]